MTKSAKRSAAVAETVLPFSPQEFRKLLGRWFRKHARRLPWRDVDDPYATWLSEIMLQQTRVATVIDRYGEFMLRFPTLHALAGAEESEVLALWSGLGYYRRARMLLRAAQFVQRELHGKLPQTAPGLRRLPGVGEYTSAAIASIAFGECVAVVDGNVERVLLRVLGLPEKRSSKANAELMSVAQALMPRTKRSGTNPQGDHNEAMMELGATICLPRSPLCMQCPVFNLCKTRGQHDTPQRTPQRSQTVAHLLVVRKREATTEVLTEVLLQRRAADVSQMPGMLELPVLPLKAVQGREPELRLRHSITNTNFRVQIYADITLRDTLPAAKQQLEWTLITRLHELPLTGLARKALQRLRVMPMLR
jgi:A/G-specific adenine glycosylase